MSPSEKEPIVEVTLSLQVQAGQVPRVIRALTDVALSDVSVRRGQGELGFREEIDRAMLTRVVTLEAARRFYDSELYTDPKPSALAVRAFKMVAWNVPEEEREVDSSDQPIAVSRASWDKAVSAMRGNTTEDTPGLGPKMADFIDKFSEFMPIIERSEDE